MDRCLFRLSVIQEAESSSPQVAINVLEATDATGNLIYLFFKNI
jgi:hypothetical protein